MSYGDSSLFPLIKQFLYMKTLEKVSKEMWENQIYPWTNRDRITSERVTPASERSLDVEQQTQENNVQLPEKITR